MNAINTSNSDHTSDHKICKFSSSISQDYIFHILQCFATKLHNSAKFMMLVSAVLMNIPNSKVCLKGESFIVEC